MGSTVVFSEHIHYCTSRELFACSVFPAWAVRPSLSHLYAGQTTTKRLMIAQTNVLQNFLKNLKCLLRRLLEEWGVNRCFYSGAIPYLMAVLPARFPAWAVLVPGSPGKGSPNLTIWTRS
ncbi:hypothetical protein NPIL_416431 [Nephila pilipes]|uniref:Uncharacterized protein n=1 Tax=Nephila pilipes TaxID=299642 RepID=A0A8X6JDM2_NEPPI|nr:hypothetical protein NPIL_416431 [Nephila pilipes]